MQTASLSSEDWGLRARPVAHWLPTASGQWRQEMGGWASSPGSLQAEPQVGTQPRVCALTHMWSPPLQHDKSCPQT